MIIWEQFFHDLSSNTMKWKKEKEKRKFWIVCNRETDIIVERNRNAFRAVIRLWSTEIVSSRAFPSKMGEKEASKKGKREEFESKNFDGPEQWRLSCSVSSGIKKLRIIILGRFKTRGLSRFIWGSGLKTSGRDEGKSWRPPRDNEKNRAMAYCPFIHS